MSSLQPPVCLGPGLAQIVLAALVLRLAVALLGPAPSAAGHRARAEAVRVARQGPLGALLADPGGVSPGLALLTWPIVAAYTLVDPALAGWEGRRFGPIAHLPAILADLWLLLVLHQFFRRRVDEEVARQAAWAWALNPAAVLGASLVGAPEAVALAVGAQAVLDGLDGRALRSTMLGMLAVAASPWGILFACIALVVAGREGTGTTPRAGSDAGPGGTWGQASTVRAGLGLALGAGLLLSPMAADVSLTALGDAYTRPWTGHGEATREAFNPWWLLLGPADTDDHVVGAISLGPLSSLVRRLTARAPAPAPAKDRVAAEITVKDAALVLALLGLAASLAQIMATADALGTWASVGLCLLLTGLVAPRVEPPLLVWPLAFLGGVSGWRGLYVLLTGVVAMNMVHALGAWQAWCSAAHGGWGSALAGAVLLVVIRSFVRTAFTSDDLWPRGETHPSPPPVAQVPKARARPAGPGRRARRRGERDATDPPRARPWVRDLAILLVLTSSVAALRWYNIGNPEAFVFDEVYHAKAGHEIMAGKAPNEWVHPPLAKVLIGLAERPLLNAAGEITSVGWRLAPFIAGTLVVPILYLLGLATLGDRRAAAIGTLLFAMDGVFFVLSRMAMTNAFAVLFEVAALTTLYHALRQALDPTRPAGVGWSLLACGIALGLGISTRWTNVWGLAMALGLYSLAVAYRFAVLVRDRPAALRAALAVVALVSTAIHILVLPLSIYVASYWPLVSSKAYNDFHYVMHLQPMIYKFHTTFTTHHPYYSQWFTWCFTHRPVWYHYKDVEGTVHGIIALGNPVLWWASVPALLLGLVLAARTRHAGLAFLLLCYASLYAPWSLSPRVFNYSHYYLQPLPYACLVMGLLLTRAFDRAGSDRSEAVSLAALSLAAFAFFYPIYAAVPISSASYSVRIWSRFWI